MSRGELTEAAWRLLARAKDGDACVQPRGAAVSALQALGYVEWDGRASQRTWWLAITEAGRRALAQHQGEDDRG